MGGKKVITIPAPTGGWNARDDYGAVEGTEAIILDNLLPRDGSCRTMGAMVAHATGMAGTCETLMAWRGPASQKLLAAGGGAVYNVTSAGAVGAALGSGYANDRWQHVQFGGYLIAVNGANTPKKYDGSTWSDTVFTGPADSTKLINICAHKARLWMAEKDTSTAWYGATDAIAGALTAFPLASFAPSGGHLLAIATWSRDGGAGPDDLIVFIMSSGSAIVYQGTDPSSASTWALVGAYEIHRPLGRRCWTKWGADCILLTSQGYFPLSALLATDRSGPFLALSDRIRGAVIDAADGQEEAFGWQATVSGGLLWISTPTAYTHVMSVTTGAWCRYTMRSPLVHIDFGGDLYIGYGSGVQKYGAFTGSNISTAIYAWQTGFGIGGGFAQRKRFSFPKVAFRGDAGTLTGLASTYKDNFGDNAVVSGISTIDVLGDFDGFQSAESFVSNTASLYFLATSLNLASSTSWEFPEADLFGATILVETGNVM
jgi:hypothetical protein